MEIVSRSWGKGSLFIMWSTIREVGPGTVEITNSALLLGMCVLAGVGFVAASLYVLIRHGKWQWSLLISIGTLMSVVFFLLFGTERLLISPTEIRETSGFPGATHDKVLNLSEVRTVTMTTVERRKGQSGKKRTRRQLSLAVTNASGVTTHLKPGGLWKNHLDRTVEAMKGAGITVKDDR
jgi:cation transport ATPase